MGPKWSKAAKVLCRKHRRDGRHNVSAQEHSQNNMFITRRKDAQPDRPCSNQQQMERITAHVRTYRCADIGSDHDLVIARIYLKPVVTKKTKLPPKLNTETLQVAENAARYADIEIPFRNTRLS